MNKYYLYMIHSDVKNDDSYLCEYEVPELGLNVDIDISTLKEKSIKKINYEDFKSMRYSGLIDEVYYNRYDLLPYNQYFIAIEHKNRYYCNELKIKNGRLIGSLPSFWTNFKYSFGLTIYLIVYFFLAFKLINFILR